MRRPRHCRASTLNSNSAMFSQLPCFGVCTNSSSVQQRARLGGREALVQRRTAMRAQVVQDQRDALRLWKVLFHQATHALQPTSRLV